MNRYNFSRKNNNPCFGCVSPKRCVGCRSVCKKWKDYEENMAVEYSERRIKSSSYYPVPNNNGAIPTAYCKRRTSNGIVSLRPARTKVE